MRKGFLIVAVALFPISQLAAGNTPTTQELFKSLDTNKDGYISQQEAKANPKLAKQWDSADANSDGKIEESEFSAFEAGAAPTYVPEENSDEPTIGAEPTK
jgi:Ca2+-binding EF-hand superfamily protein